MAAQVANCKVDQFDIGLCRVALHKVIEQLDLFVVLSIGFERKQKRDYTRVQKLAEIADEGIQRKTLGKKFLGIVLQVLGIDKSTRFDLFQRIVQKVHFLFASLLAETRLIVNRKCREAEMSLVSSDEFSDIVDVGILFQDVFFLREVSNLCRNRNHFHARKFVQAVTHLFDIHVRRQVNAIGFHGFQHVVNLVVHGTVNRLLARHSRREHAKIPFQGQESILDHIVKGSAAFLFVGIRQNFRIGDYTPAQILVVTFFLLNA